MFNDDTPYRGLFTEQYVDDSEVLARLEQRGVVGTLEKPRRKRGYPRAESSIKWYTSSCRTPYDYFREHPNTGVVKEEGTAMNISTFEDEVRQRVDSLSTRINEIEQELQRLEPLIQERAEVQAEHGRLSAALAAYLGNTEPAAPAVAITEPEQPAESPEPARAEEHVNAPMGEEEQEPAQPKAEVVPVDNHTRPSRASLKDRPRPVRYYKKRKAANGIATKITKAELETRDRLKETILTEAATGRFAPTITNGDIARAFGWPVDFKSSPEMMENYYQIQDAAMELEEEGLLLRTRETAWNTPDRSSPGPNPGKPPYLFRLTEAGQQRAESLLENKGEVVSDKVVAHPLDSPTEAEEPVLPQLTPAQLAVYVWMEENHNKATIAELSMRFNIGIRAAGHLLDALVDAGAAVKVPGVRSGRGGRSNIYRLKGKPLTRIQRERGFEYGSAKGVAYSGLRVSAQALQKIISHPSSTREQRANAKAALAALYESEDATAKL